MLEKPLNFCFYGVFQIPFPQTLFKISFGGQLNPLSNGSHDGLCSQPFQALLQKAAAIRVVPHKYFTHNGDDGLAGYILLFYGCKGFTGLFKYSQSTISATFNDVDQSIQI